MTPWWHTSEVLTAADRELIDRAAGDPAVAAAIPSELLALARRRARSAVDSVTAGCPAHTVRHSVAGVEWSRDIDLHWSRLPDPSVFSTAGWRSLSDLLVRLGRAGEGRWAIVAEGDVVGAADVTTDAAPDPVTSCLRRAVLGATIREVLEMRVLQRSGRASPGSLGLADVAALERWYGGSEIDAAKVTRGQRACGFLRHAVAHRPRRRRPRVIVAFSGVDGAGKSTLIKRFAAELELAGLPHTVLWARPGHDIGWLDAVARGLKRLLGRQPEPGLRSISAGRETAPPSRRGIAGWLWARLMLVDFVIRVRRALARADGIVVHDRYAIDAAVTLAFGYGLERPWVTGLLKRVMPRPDVHVYLDVDVDTARLRKPHDPMGEFALTAQLDRYRRALADELDIEILDATQSPGVLGRRVWDLLLNTGS